MKYSVVFSSKTGNTQALAEAVLRALPKTDCQYCGTPDKAVDAPLIFAGFWTDKGTCDDASASYLQSLRGRQVFLFGTAGFGGNEEYFDRILGNVRTKLDSSNSIVGTFMCQGRMPGSVRARYEAMLAEKPDDAKICGMLENFDRALPHPDEADLSAFTQQIQKILL